jgi:hypothetical protein
MPRQTLARTSSPGPNPAAGVAVTFTAADVTEKEKLALTGREIVLVHNTGASSRTYTITSTEDPFGRTKDISAVSIAAGAIHTVGPFGLAGWAQTDGSLYLEANNAEVKFAVVALP